MLGKKFTKKLAAIMLMVFASVVVVGEYNAESPHAVPAKEDRYTEGDRQFTINLSNTESSAGANPGAVDFNGNGKYDESEMLPIKGTEDFKVATDVKIEEKKFVDIVGVEGKVLRNNTVVVREDKDNYQKGYLRDGSTGGYIYVKVKFEGDVEKSLKASMDKAIEEVKRNESLLAQGKGNEISLVNQEILATIIQNSLGMVDQSGNQVNKDFKLAVSFKSGSKSEVRKISIDDILMDTTMGKQNAYTNTFNAPKIIDEAGNVYFKIYGLPSGSEIDSVKFEGVLSFPSVVDKSIVKTMNKQKESSSKAGVIPFIDPMLTENVNADNANPLDPITINPTSIYFIDISLDEAGELTNTPNGIIEYMGPYYEGDNDQGYKHAHIRPLDTQIVFYDAIYDPENTIKRIEIKDSNGKVYTVKLLKEDTKIGTFQGYGSIEGVISSPETNSSAYKDFVIEGLTPNTEYKFEELSIVFNSGEGDINRRFTNYDSISKDPLIIKTMGDLNGGGQTGSELLETLELQEVTPTKAVYKLGINDPDGIIKDIRIEGDSIAQSAYDSEAQTVTLYGVTPNHETLGLELVIQLITDEELGLELEAFKSKRVTNSKEWIEGFYNIFFLRDGDQTGMDYWSSKLSSQEFSVNYFATNIVNEQEFKEKNLDNQKFVERMYRSVTGRTSDAEGLAWWTQTLTQTVTETGDRTNAMQIITLRMLGEAETKNFLISLGMKVE